MVQLQSRGAAALVLSEVGLKAEERNTLFFTLPRKAPSLSPRIIRRYKNNYSGAFYRRFISGEQTAAQSLVCGLFDPDSDARTRPASKWSPISFRPLRKLSTETLLDEDMTYSPEFILSNRLSNL